MNLLHVAPLSWKSPNGVTDAVTGAALAQSRLPQTRVAILVSSRDPGPVPRLEVPVLCRQDIPWILRRRAVWETVEKRIFHPDLVVFHSTFVPFHAEIAGELRARGIPYVICPHGGMTQEALRHKSLKKWLGRQIFFDGFVAGAAAIQYLTQGEFEHSGDWSRPVIISGNGVFPPSDSQLARPGTRRERVFLFLGRLHVQHKGLDVLLEAVARCQAELRQRRATVRIVGPDCDGSANELMAEIAERALADLVSVEGPVWGEAKSREFAGADVFLHPSRTEGHPTAVLEALAHGLPVVLTPETNVLHEVMAAGAGWGVSCDAEDLAKALVRLATVDSAILARAGQAARKLALERYTWDHVAEKTLGKYRRLFVSARVA